MRLIDIFKDKVIKITLSGKNKYQVIEELVDYLNQIVPIKNKTLALQDVLDREQYLSTGLENGLAVPHGKTNGVTKMLIALGVSKEGVDFDSLDGKKSHLIFLILSPKDSSGPHIQTLAQIARKVKDTKIRERLILSNSSDEIMAIFNELDQEK